MTWLNQLKGCDDLKAFLHHMSVCVIVSKPGGAILWTNKAFEEWSGYSSEELQRAGWKQIVVSGADFDRDPDASEQWEAYSPIYRIRTRYNRKDASPCWGTLTAMRFPPIGDIEFCVCTWIPHQETTNAALDTALAAIQKSEKATKELSDSFAAYSQISTEQRFIVTATELAKKYPKVTWAIIAFGFGLFGLNNALEILKTIHLVPPVVTLTAPTIPQSP